MKILIPLVMVLLLAGVAFCQQAPQPQRVYEIASPDRPTGDTMKLLWTSKDGCKEDLKEWVSKEVADSTIRSLQAKLDSSQQAVSILYQQGLKSYSEWMRLIDPPMYAVKSDTSMEIYWKKREAPKKSSTKKSKK